MAFAAYHLENHMSWMAIVEQFKHQVNFRGIMMTGWQRYDHFSVLCELFPVGIPSLILNLYYIQNYKHSKLFTFRTPFYYMSYIMYSIMFCLFVCSISSWYSIKTTWPSSVWHNVSTSHQWNTMCIPRGSSFQFSSTFFPCSKRTWESHYWNKQSCCSWMDEWPKY